MAYSHDELHNYFNNKQGNKLITAGVDKLLSLEASNAQPIELIAAQIKQNNMNWGNYQQANYAVLYHVKNTAMDSLNGYILLIATTDADTKKRHFFCISTNQQIQFPESFLETVGNVTHYYCHVENTEYHASIMYDIINNITKKHLNTIDKVNPIDDSRLNRLIKELDKESIMDTVDLTTLAEAPSQVATTEPSVRPPISPVTEQLLPGPYIPHANLLTSLNHAGQTQKEGKEYPATKEEERRQLQQAIQASQQESSSTSNHAGQTQKEREEYLATEEEQRQLQQAIQASLQNPPTTSTPTTQVNESTIRKTKVSFSDPNGTSTNSMSRSNNPILNLLGDKEGYPKQAINSNFSYEVQLLLNKQTKIITQLTLLEEAFHTIIAQENMNEYYHTTSQKLAFFDTWPGLKNIWARKDQRSLSALQREHITALQRLQLSIAKTPDLSEVDKQYLLKSQLTAFNTKDWGFQSKSLPKTAVEIYHLINDDTAQNKCPRCAGRK